MLSGKIIDDFLAIAESLPIDKDPGFGTGSDVDIYTPKQIYLFSKIDENKWLLRRETKNEKTDIVNTDYLTGFVNALNENKSIEILSFH